jgi:hypothetical protein
VGRAAVSDFVITDLMLNYGGSFAQALAQCWRVADVTNQGRLKAAFPEIWADYAHLAEDMRADRRARE